MFEKMEELERRFQELESLLADPAVIGNQTEFRRFSREHAELSALVDAYRRYRKVLAEISDNRELLGDPDMKEMVAEELQSLDAEKERLEGEIQFLVQGFPRAEGFLAQRQRLVFDRQDDLQRQCAEERLGVSPVVARHRSERFGVHRLVFRLNSFVLLDNHYFFGSTHQTN